MEKNADDILRKGEADYKAYFAAVSRTDEKALFDLLVAHPKVIERPIFISGFKAVIGRLPKAISVYSRLEQDFCLAKNK